MSERNAAAPPGPPQGSGSVAFLLAQVGAHAGARFAERIAPLDLRPQHAGALRIVGLSAGLSQRALAERLGVLPSRLVLLVDELEARGLVERRDDPADRRSYAVHLTERGRTALRALGAAAREHQEDLLAALAGPEREQLGELLRRIAGQQGLTPGVHPGFKALR